MSVNIFQTKTACALWENNAKEGVILCAKGSLELLYMNMRSRKMLQVKRDAVLITLRDLMEEEYLKKIYEPAPFYYHTGKRKLTVTAAENEDFRILILSDRGELDNLRKKYEDLTQINQDLLNICEQYGDETIGIIGADGIIEVTNQTYAAKCGIPLCELIGSSVYDLEKRKVFYPSVTRLVLESRKTEFVLQKTQREKQYICIGVPIFDRDGEIIKVISITKGFLRQVKIGAMISKMHPWNTGAGDPENEERFFTCNIEMNNLIRLAKIVAGTEATVLIKGETGTGKNVMAEFIRDNSTRSGKPFVKVNCGAISPSLVESELFGYEPGTFTGANREGKRGLIEAADGGILFLDEISELPSDQQVKLLQILQERKMVRVGGTESVDLDIRVIAATNKPLEALVKTGVFREDLFYRLNVVPLEIPALRNRPEDIPLLIKYFVREFNKRYGKEMEFSEEAFDCMKAYSWPGNVRELENTVERLVIMTRDAIIEEEDLPPHILGEISGSESQEAVAVKRVIPLAQAIEEVEAKLIRKAMQEYPSAKAAAEALGVDPSTISRKRRLYQVE